VIVLNSTLTSRAIRATFLGDGHWLPLQKRMMPWSNIALALLLVTGFVQMTSDSNYAGFLRVDTLWAQAILVKHLAIIGMIALGAYTQFRLLPDLARIEMLARGRRERNDGEMESLLRRERALQRLSIAGAVVVLFFTAMATAI